MKKRLLLVDGSGYIFRAYHALPPLRRPDGLLVNAVFGFCTMITRTLFNAQLNPTMDRVIVIFDAARQTFRQEIYAEYKAHRPPAPEDLIPQMQLIRDACAAFNLPAIELPGFEADDLIASYADVGVEEDYSVIVISSDKDLMQLIRPGITMFDPLKNKVIGEDQVFEKFGVQPNRVVDVQALAGDSSDNVPGVPGIGIKTAASLIQTYGDLETLLARAGEITQNKRRESLIQHAEMARISYQLVTLRHDVPLPTPLNDLALASPDHDQLFSFLRTQGFHSMMSRLDDAPVQKRASYETVTSIEALQAWIHRAKTLKRMAIDTETTSLDPMRAQLVGISLATSESEACYIPVAHQCPEDGDLLHTQLSLETLHEHLGPLLTDPAVVKIGHNIKYDLVVLHRHGFQISPLHDTMLMSYVLDAGLHGHSLDELSERHFHHQTIKYKDVTGTGKAQITFDQVPIEQATRYAAEDADMTWRLYEFFQPRLMKEKMLSLYERFERPLIPVLVSMEEKGILIDPAVLHRAEAEFSAQIKILETEIYALAGKEFLISSQKQLGEVLFDDMDLPGKRKTKTGSYVTDSDVLEALVLEGHKLPEKIIEWRSLAKLRSTYIEGLLEAIHPETHRIHTSYAMATTSTGRLASSDPNLQNIPVRTANGRKIRAAFIAKSGCKLLSIDYTQIELRLLAHMADVPVLLESFRQDLDVHAVTAASIFNCPLSEVTPELRRRAKTINFAIIYGSSAQGLAQQLRISRQEAADHIQAYFEKYPGIQEYMERSQEFARQHGYVLTLFGRKCYTPSINDSNFMNRQFAERQAINAPLQGTNADIIKRAMIQIPSLLARHNLSADMLLQVHDELLFEVPESELQETIQLVQHAMENVINLKLPLLTHTTVADNWSQTSS